MSPLARRETVGRDKCWVDEVRGAAFARETGADIGHADVRMSRAARDKSTSFSVWPAITPDSQNSSTRSTRVDRDFERTDPPFRTETFSNFRHTILPQENDFVRHSFCFTFGSGVASFVAIASDFKLHRCGFQRSETCL